MLITAIGGSREAGVRATLDRLPRESASVLVVPTACSVKSGFDRKVGEVTKLFGELGVPATVLHGFGEVPTRTRVQHEIGKASLIYTVGGNTPHLFRLFEEWRDSAGVDEELAEAMRRGTPHCGVSAGALFPFSALHINPAVNHETEDWEFEIRQGLQVLKGVATAHANVHDKTPHGQRPDTRLENLLATFPDDQPFGLGLDHGATAIITPDDPQIIRSPKTPAAQVHWLEPLGYTNERGYSASARPIDDPMELLRLIPGA